MDSFRHLDPLCGNDGDRPTSEANTELTDEHYDDNIHDELIEDDDMDVGDIEAAHDVVNVTDIQARRNRIIFAIIIGVITLVSIVVGVSLSSGSKKGNEPQGNPGAAGGHASNNTKTSAVVLESGPPIAPSNLIDICSPRMTNGGEEGMSETCHEVCSAAYCCESTCYHHENCLGYEPCWGKGGSTIGITPPDQGEAIIGNDSDKPVPAIDILVQEACTRALIDTIDGRFACEELCQERSCCYGPKGLEGGNCYEESPDWCGEYAPCMLLHSDSSISEQEGITGFDEGTWNDEEELPSPLSPTADGSNLDDELDLENYSNGSGSSGDVYEVSLACKPENIGLNPKNCMKKCDPYRCCFIHQENVTWCYKDKEQWCKEYSACQIVYGSFYYLDMNTTASTLGALSSNISTTSTNTPVLDLEEDEIEIEVEQEDEVEIEVEQEEVEIEIEVEGQNNNNSSSFPSNSLAQSNVFGVSSNTKPQEENAEMAVPEVDLKCTQQSIRTRPGFDDCKRICDKRLCCFLEGQGNCYSRNPVLCNEYLSCQTLYQYIKDQEEEKKQEESSQNAENKKETDGITYESSQQDEGIVNANDLQQQVKSVEEACSTENLQSTKGRGECEAICAPAECCFVQDAEFNCKGEYKSWCDDFAPCQVLSKESSQGLGDASQSASLWTKESEIRHACSPEMLTNIDGWMECTMLCENRKCCHLGSCGKGGYYCNDYDLCRTIENNDGIPTSGSTSHITVDNEEQTPLEMAESVTPSDVRRACAREKIQLDMFTCENKCESKMCCFSKGSDNCMADTSKECFNFFPCQILLEESIESLDDTEVKMPSLNDSASAAGGGAPPSPPNLSDLCSPNAIRTEIGCGACKDVCTPAKCCANPNDGLCDQTMCIAYGSCQTIWMMGDFNDACQDKSEWKAEPTNP